MRIFLSYGHEPPEHVEVARRIKKDLESRGHSVWYDCDKLNASREWAKDIEHAIVASDRVLLIMTPHSVRRGNPIAAPDDPSSKDGYCLNEIAKAVERNKLIVPIMLAWLDQGPPLSICRIQWLDMRDCVPLRQKHACYEARFPQLVKALENGRLDAEGEWAYVVQHLRPLDFIGQMQRHITRFEGREWVLGRQGAIAKWIDNPEGSHVFWIIGDPGTGKSAIATQLSHHGGDVAAIHFCVHGHDDFTHPGRALLSIAYHLANRLHGYYAYLLRLDLDAEARKNTYTLFHNLLVAPLVRLDRTPGFERPRALLVVIDGLDEATTADGKNAFAEFIAAHWGETPPWLRLLVTSQNDPAVRRHLFHVEAQSLLLDSASEQHLEDVRTVIRRALPEAPGAPDALDSAVEAVVRKSEGSVLCACLLADELKRGGLTPKALEALPRGLAGYYQQWFPRHFPDVSVYNAVFRPILEAVCAARAPLPVQFLAAATQVDCAEARRRLESLAVLFPIRTGPSSSDASDTVGPYHRSVCQWLTTERNGGGFYLAGDYRIDPAAGNSRLASAGWREFTENPGRMSEYARACLPTHLREAGRWGELLQLVASRDVGLIERWVDCGEAERGLACLADLLTHAGLPPRYQAAIATQAARICSQRGEYEEAERHLDFASAQTSWLRGRRTRTVAMHEIGSLRLYQGDRDGAERLYYRALCLCIVGWPVYRDEAAANLVALATSACARYFWRRAVRLSWWARLHARAAGNVLHALAADRILASALDEMGRHDEAFERIRGAIEESNQSGTRVEHARLLGLLAWMSYDRAALTGQPFDEAARQFAEASDAAGRIHLRHTRLDADMGCALCALAVGDTVRAANVLTSIRAVLPGHRHFDLQAGIGLGEAGTSLRNGQLPEAMRKYEDTVKLAKQYGFEEAYAKALVGMGSIEWHSGERHRGKELWTQARRHAERKSVRAAELAAANIALCRGHPCMPPR